MRPLRTVFNAFDRVFPFTVWLVFLGGIVGLIGTAVGLLPPFGDSAYAKVVSCLGWFLVTSEAYYELRDRLAEEDEAHAIPPLP